MMRRFFMPRTALWLPLMLLTAGPGSAQTIPAIGTDATLDVATWNIEWFGDPNNGPSDEARQFRNVRAVIEQSGIDLWAVQEIADETDWHDLLQALGPEYDGQLATLSGSQRIGFLYRTDVIGAAAAAHILEEFSDDFAGRPPLQMAATVTLPDTTIDVLFIVVHMKAFGDRTSYEKRAEASRRLKSRLDFIHDDDALFVMGDFNDELSHSTYVNNPSPYANFVQDDDYSFLTQALEQADVGTWCGNSSSCGTGSTIDHILISDELFPAYVEGSSTRFSELLSALDQYVSTTSDHLPVYAQFRFSTDTAMEEETPVLPVGLEVFPNPARDVLRVRYVLARPGSVQIRLYDVLGRAVASYDEPDTPSGEHLTDIALGGLASGSYIVRMVAGESVETRHIVHLP